MGTDADRAQSLTTAGELLLFFALGLAPLAAGTVHTGTTAAVYLLCLVALALRTAGTDRAARWRLPPLALVLGLVFGWVVATILPLPMVVLQGASPILAELMDHRAVEGMTSPRLTYSPGGTAWEIVKLAGALSALWLASQIAATEDGARRAVVAVAAIAVLFLLVSILQTLTRTEQVLWLYRPLAAASLGAYSPVDFRTPFVNPNHAAQFLELAGVGALAFAALDHTARRGVWFAVGLLCVGAVFATGSAGGLVCSGAALVFVLTLWIAAARPRLRFVRFVVPAMVLLAGIIGLGVTVHAGLTGGDLPRTWIEDERAAAKTEVWPGVVRLARAHAWTGVGRGGLRDAVPRVQEPGGIVTRSYAENEYLQLPAELGLPVALLLVLGFALTWVFALARFEDEPHVAAALAGTLAVGAHAFVGFGLEFAGVGLPFVVLMGVCASHAGLLGAGRWIGALVALIVVAGLPFVPLAVQHGNHFRATSAIGRAPVDADIEEVTSRVRWRPVSPDVSIALAGYFDRRGEPGNTLVWLNRTMILAPQEAQPHLMAARTLASMGAREQALLEVEAAVVRSGPYRREIFALLADLARDPAEARAAVGGDPAIAADFAEYLIAQDGHSSLGRALMTDLDEDGLALPGLARAQAQAAMVDGDLDRAVVRLRHALELKPGDGRSTRLLARCIAVQGRPDEARALIVEGLAAHADDPWFLMEAARVELAAGDLGAARRYLREAVAVTPRHQRSILAVEFALEGDLHLAGGRPVDARDSFQRALRMDPDRHSVRIKLAETLVVMGQIDGALREYRRVQERSGAYSRLDSRIQQLEQQQGASGATVKLPGDETLDGAGPEGENKRSSTGAGG
jgi:Flp pilus assembly protein TadD